MRYILLIFLSFLTGCGSAVAYYHEWKFPAQGSFVTVDSHRLHYIDSAPDTDLPTVVYIHGSLGSVHDLLFSPAYRELVKTHRVIAYDRPGSGYSFRGRFDVLDPEAHADVLHALLRKLRIVKPVLFAHSWGGAVALGYALKFPENTSGLVLVAPAAYPWEGDDVYLSNVIPPIPVVGDLFMETVFAPLALLAEGSALGAVFDPDPVPADYRHVASAMAIRPSQFIAASQDMATLRRSLRSLSARYSSIDAPVIVMSGTADSIVPPQIHAVPLVRAVGCGALVLLEGSGHQPLFSRSDAVLQALDQISARRCP